MPFIKNRVDPAPSKVALFIGLLHRLFSRVFRSCVFQARAHQRYSSALITGPNWRATRIDQTDGRAEFSAFKRTRVNNAEAQASTCPEAAANKVGQPAVLLLVHIQDQSNHHDIG